MSRDAEQFVSRLMVDYACDRGVGDPLSWSPMAVELFLLDFATRKVMWESDDIPQVTPVVSAYVVWALEQRGLAQSYVDETVAAVDRYGGDFVAAVLDGTDRGPAAAIVEGMLAEGIDLSDEAAVARWIARYNDSLGG